MKKLLPHAHSATGTGNVRANGAATGATTPGRGRGLTLHRLPRDALYSGCLRETRKQCADRQSSRCHIVGFLLPWLV